MIESILRYPLEHGNIIAYIPVTSLLTLSQITPRASGKFLGPFLTCSLFWRTRDINEIGMDNSLSGGFSIRELLWTYFIYYYENNFTKGTGLDNPEYPFHSYIYIVILI